MPAGLTERQFICLCLSSRRWILSPLPPPHRSSTPNHTMSKPTTLSVEVWEHIIDIVSQTFLQFSRRQTLSACALTCRSWVPRSRLHLYSSVFLDTDQIKAFIVSMALNPSNGRFVRRLVLRGTYDRPKRQADLILVPVRLPDRLPNLVHISFFDIRFSVLHSSFFDHLCRFRKVRCIVCSGATSSSLHRVAQLVRCFPRLERLRSLGWRQDDSEPLSPTPLTNSRLYQKVRVPHLVWNHDSKQKHVLGLFSPSAIVSLNIDYKVGDNKYDSVLLLLRKCKNTLRHLKLRVESPAQGKGPSALCCTHVLCTTNPYCLR